VLVGPVNRVNKDAGDDKLFGGGARDVLRAYGGNDFLRGGAGDDRLEGGEGTDRLSGGAGNDFLFGQQGKDSYAAGPGRDKLLSGDSIRERVDCGGGFDTVYIGFERDRLIDCEKRIKPPGGGPRQ
jgi:Ca2+-binding RTX toxin-like protein